MHPFDLVIRSRRVATPGGERPAAVGVAGGRIIAVSDYSARLEGRHEVDLGGAALLPGGVDTGIGVQVPGRSLADSYAHTSRLALDGGFTTLIAAPAPALPAVTDASAIREHARAAACGLWVNVALLGGVRPGVSQRSVEELHAAGVVGFYGSLSDGGGPDLPALDDTALRTAMGAVAAVDGVLLIHAEDRAELGDTAQAGASAFLTARPPVAERRGAERVVSAARATGTRAHITPFVAAECAAMLAAARSMGVRVSAHTCPHYLCLPTEQVPENDEGYRCRPPLRPNANRTALWRTLLDGELISGVASGHRPGAGVETLPWSLPALWTALQRRGLDLAHLSRWFAQEPAHLMGLDAKGRVEPGYDADLVAFDPDTEQQAAATGATPYAGRWLRGRVLATWLGGHRAEDEPGATLILRTGR